MKKPLHKRIRHHASRVKNHITKYLYKRDTLFSTLWVFIFIVVLGSIPINFYFLNPLKLALKDFDFNDMAYAKLDVHADSMDKHIVVLNIGKADRSELAALIDAAGGMQPKVIGLDVLFEGPRDSAADAALKEVVQKYPQLVLASKLNWEDKADPYKENHFSTDKTRQGYANMLTDDISTVRLWAPWFENETDHNARPYNSFAATVLEKYDSASYARLMKRHKPVEMINYSRRQRNYQVIQPENLMAGEVDSGYIKGSILLMGYVNENPDDIEDKKFTPMNEKYYGKSIPDMNGVFIHANILSMALENSYITKLPTWFNWLVAILIGWLHMAIFIKYYLDHHIWFHLVAKIAQLLSAIFFAYAGIWMFEKFRIKLDMKLTLYVIVMAVDVIYFYEAWAGWMHRRFRYRTVFGHHGHGHAETAHPPHEQHTESEKNTTKS